MDNIKCSICNGHNNKPLFMKEGLQIIRCKNCKVVYVHPPLPSNRIANIYDEEGYYSEIIAHDKRKCEKERFPWGKAMFYIGTLLDNKGKLLDVGSGTGFFLNLAKERGWEVCGIEPSSFAYNYSIGRYNYNIINKALKEANLQVASFDVVTLWNVLEHLNDPLDLLCDVNRVVKNGGLIALSVPNIDSFEAGLFRENWAELEPLAKGHMCYFSPYSIKYILNKAAFRIEKIFSIGGFGFRSHISKRDKSPAGNKSFILEGVASVARHIVGVFKKGGILIVIARKTKKSAV